MIYRCTNRPFLLLILVQERKFFFFFLGGGSLGNIKFSVIEIGR